MPFLLASMLILFFTPLARAETTTVAAAVSLRDALSDIGAKYKSETNDEVRLVFGSSGQLMGQIRNGAPVDLFISAADKQVDDLSKEGLVLDATRVVIAGNTLVLIVPADAKSPPTGFQDLADLRHKRIAIGEPKTVPAGEYAMQVLSNLKLADAVAKRTIHATNVRQVLSYVERGEVDAGIVYLTDALESGGDKVSVAAKADAKLHAPIRYTAIIVKATKRQPAAQRFLDYLRQDPARTILKDKGFGTADTQPHRQATIP